jgi:hypothetical protein
MKDGILPKDIRLKIIGLFNAGLSSLEVYDQVCEEALRHVASDNQLLRCISRLRCEANNRTGEKEELKSESTASPKPKTFDNTKHMHIINSLCATMPGKDFEKACHPIVFDILKNYEGFCDIVDSNDVKGFHNPPFDFLGFKDDKAFIIEFKGSLENFNSPGETQKRRMQELLKQIKDLNIALLQVSLRNGRYRIMYNREMDLLFDAREVSLEPVVKWILARISGYQVKSR